MAFNTEEGRVEYTASTGQTIFTFLFKIYEDTDIKVYQTPSGSAPNDTTDLLTINTDYTVVVDGDNGGSVTLTVATTAADAITIQRQLPTDRDFDYQTGGDLLADTLDDDQNYQTYLIADQEAKENRSLTLPDSVQGVSTELPVPEALKVMRWKAAEDGLENIAIGDNDTFINILNIDNVDALSSVDTSLYATVNIRGYFTVNDGGGGIFNYDSTQLATNNGGTIIDGWVRQYSGTINAKWFGAKGDGVDDSTALTTLSTLGKEVFFPNGTYKGNPLFLSTNTKFIGEDIDLTIFDIPTDRDEITIWIKNSGCAVENATIKTTMSNIGSGTNGTMVTVGMGTNIEEPLAEVSDTILRNLKGINLGEPCNAITVIGNINGIIIDNIDGDGFAQGIVAHWGSNRNADLTFIKSYYPHDITMTNLSFSNLDNGGVFISGCYNVSVNHMNLLACGQVLSIVAGDSVGDEATIEDTIMKNISIDNVYAEGISGSDTITIDGEGHEPTSDLWGRIDFGSVSLSNIYVSCSAATGATLITDANGVTIENITVDMSSVSSSSIACSVNKSKDISIENLITSAPAPIRIDRSEDIKIDKIFATNKLGTTSFGVDIRGFRYSDTLNGDINILDTTITINTLFPVRVYKGDIIRLTSDPTKFAVVNEHYADTTTIIVEPLTFGALNGDSVFLDTRTRGVSISNSTLIDYFSGISDDVSAGALDILNVVATNNTISKDSVNYIDLTKTEHINLVGNILDDGELIIYPFTPAFSGVTVAYTNQDGNYYIQNGICYFEMEIDYNTLDTADGSAIQIAGFPIAPKSFGNGNIQTNTYLSTGFNFAATDTIRPLFWDANSNIILADASGALVGYNGGKILAAGKILLSGSYYV